MDHSAGFLKLATDAKSRVRENTPEDVDEVEIFAFLLFAAHVAKPTEDLSAC